MKTKKGFTLIEIIICIALLSVLGVSSVLIATNTNKNKELENITKKVLEAANVYIETEKDKHGNTYSYGIDNGGKGITIPLNTLVNKGYVQNEDANKIKSLVNYSEDKDYYILLAETNDLCDSGVPFTKASWEIGDEEIYLCDYTPTPEGGGCGEQTDFITELLSNYGGESSIELKDEITKDDYVVGTDYKLITTDAKGQASVAEIYVKESGIFKKKDGTYYFRGDIDDNYIILPGKGLFRIINFNKNEVRLISEKIPSYMMGDSSLFSVEGDYGSSNLKENLEGWIGADIGWYEVDGEWTCNDEFVKKTNFCNDTKIGEYYKSMNTDKDPCKNKIEAKVGLLTVEEANYAGIPKSIRSVFDYFDTFNDFGQKCSERNDNICELFYPFAKSERLSNPPNLQVYHNNSYLTTGDSTITLTKYGKESYMLSNYIFREDEYVRDIKGKLFLVSASSIDQNYFRPVLSIDLNEVESFSGKGTKNVPYRLEPKKN